MTSLALAGEISDLAGVEAAAFDDPPTATLKAKNVFKSVSTKKEQKFGKSFSNEKCLGKTLPHSIELLPRKNSSNQTANPAKYNFFHREEHLRM